MVRWRRWHCHPDNGLEIWAVAVWGRACYLSHKEFLWVSREETLCFFEIECQCGGRTRDLCPYADSFNHCTRAPPLQLWQVNHWWVSLLHVSRSGYHIKWKQEIIIFTQYTVNVGPPSATLAQHWPCIMRFRVAYQVKEGNRVRKTLVCPDNTALLRKKR